MSTEGRPRESRSRAMLFLTALIGGFLVFNEAQAQTPPAPAKILVVYFSRTGNTAEVAKQIHASVDSDLFRIEMEDPYPGDYEATKTRARNEQESGAKPALKTKVKNIESYDVIFVGYPIWWGTIPPPIVSFLSQYDLSRKTIVPFCTHGGSGLDRSVDEIKRLCPKSTILDGLAVLGRNAKAAKNDVADWLRRIKIKK